MFAKECSPTQGDNGSQCAKRVGRSNRVTKSLFLLVALLVIQLTSFDLAAVTWAPTFPVSGKPWLAKPKNALPISTQTPLEEYPQD